MDGDGLAWALGGIGLLVLVVAAGRATGPRRRVSIKARDISGVVVGGDMRVDGGLRVGGPPPAAPPAGPGRFDWVSLAVGVVGVLLSAAGLGLGLGR